MAMESFSSVLWAAQETHTSPNYFWDNRKRGGDNHLVIQYTLEGSAFYRDSRGERQVPPGYAMLFTLHESSSYGYPRDARDPYRHRFVAFSPTASLTPAFDQVRADFDSVMPMPPKSPAQALFNEIFTRFRERSFSDRLHQSELAYRFLVALYRGRVQETHTTDPIEYGYHFVRNHFRSPANLKMIAEKCGVSREHFIRQFRQRYGEPPGVMLRRLRLEHANAMLSATPLSVEEIALASGFASRDSLSRCYRLHYGHSPRATQ
jgi:AraC-like DNA-binding protein